MLKLNLNKRIDKYLYKEFKPIFIKKIGKN